MKIYRLGCVHCTETSSIVTSISPSSLSSAGAVCSAAWTSIMTMEAPIWGGAWIMGMKTANITCVHTDSYRIEGYLPKVKIFSE